MKKKNKIMSLIIIGTLITITIGFGLYKTLIDENSFSITEKKWIDSHTNTVLSITIPNDLPVFGTAGDGVFFDFSKYLVSKLGLNINNNTSSYNNEFDDLGFKITSIYDQEGLLLYRDHFVLISNNENNYTERSNIINIKAGINSRYTETIKKYFGGTDENYNIYSTYQEITEALANGSINYALVPLNEYKSELIKSNNQIIYHISDLSVYYYFQQGKDENVNNVFKKAFYQWKDRQFEKSYNENNYKLFINSLGISEAEEDTLTNKVYKYGFAENRPYEILANGEYGGITAQYLQYFSDFSGVEFSFKKYKNANDLAVAAVNNKIDLYYNYYSTATNYFDVGEKHSINYYVIADNSIDLSISNIQGLAFREVYVLDKSYLYEYISSLGSVDVKTYKNNNELKKLSKKNKIILIDENTYDYYLNNLINTYSVRNKGEIPVYHYSFRYKNSDDAFYRLFDSYTRTIDPNDLIRKGITTYNNVATRGKIVFTIASSIIIIAAISLILVLVYYKNNKRIKINTKVKKEDRLKYIDLLTSLKNRNYFNERLNTWNKNTIYPQSCIVMDINRVKELNDSYGHEEGDKLIQSVANVLIKTQIDNTEIMRTDGNEFLVYMVGYQEKQIISYMKKLVKEFDKLPYDNDVAMGFSMIEDDTKLVEDAFNEASIQMRENKELNEEQK